MTNAPATPLPWRQREKPHDVGHQVATCAGFEEPITGGIRLKKDASYIAHAANAYPKLIEALQWYASQSFARGSEERARDLLREFGETL